MLFPAELSTSTGIFAVDYTGPLGTYHQTPGFATFRPLTQEEVPSFNRWSELYQVYGMPRTTTLSLTQTATVPDSGSALVLLGMGLAVLVSWRRRSPKSSRKLPELP